MKENSNPGDEGEYEEEDEEDERGAKGMPPLRDAPLASMEAALRPQEEVGPL